MVGGGGLQPGGIDLDGEVLAGQCRGLALGHGVVKALSVAASHSTGISPVWPTGGVTRVHSITRSASGSPLAIPWANCTQGVVTTAAGRQGSVPGRRLPGHVAHKTTAAGVSLGCVADGVGGGGEFVGHGSGSG